MCTTSVVLVVTVFVCLHVSAVTFTPYYEKPISTSVNASSSQALRGTLRETLTSKPFPLKKTTASGANNETKNGSAVRETNRLSQHLGTISDDKNVTNGIKQQINTQEQSVISRNKHIVGKSVQLNFKTFANKQTSTSNNNITKGFQHDGKTYGNERSSTVKHYYSSDKFLPGKSVKRQSGKFGNGVTVNTESKVDALEQKTTLGSNRTNVTRDTGKEQYHSKLSKRFGRSKDMINDRVQKDNKIAHNTHKESKNVSQRQELGSRSTSKYHGLYWKKKVFPVNNDNQNIVKQNNHHHHHVHHHHHRRHHRHHHHHHHQPNTSNKQDTTALDEEERSSKPVKQYRLKPPTMRKPKPKKSEKQGKIFKTEKKITYREDPKPASTKRFVIVGGPQGVHHLKQFHFSPALVNALKLVLNKRNSFKKDADILNLAEALETKDTNVIAKNNTITTAVSSGLTQNGQRARLVTVKDPGYIKAKDQKGKNIKPKVHHDKGPTYAKANTSNDKGTGKGHLPNDVPSHIKTPQAPSGIIKDSRKNLGDVNSKDLSQEGLEQAAYRSKITEDHPHSTLVNPTSLGISILKLLFGKRANLVVKPKFKMLVNGHPDMKYLQGYGSPKQRAELQKEIEQENKLMLLKGSHHKKFEATLAKSISTLIAALSKKEKTDSSKQDSVRSKEATQEQSSDHNKETTNSGQASVLKVDTKGKQKKGQEQGTRKSWVLLKMPKTGEKEDEHVQKYEDKDEDLKQKAIKLIATVGKHNNMVTDVKVVKNRKILHDDVPDSTKKPDAMDTDTPSQTIPQITYNLNGIKTKNQLAKSPDSSAVETTLGKILKGIQDSINELKHQRKGPHSSTKIKEKVTSYVPVTSSESLMSTDTSPVSFTSSDASQASAVAKIPDLLAAVNKLLGSGSHNSYLNAVPGVPSDKPGTGSSPISVPTVDPSDAETARRYVNGVRDSNDPLLPRPDMYDEPITTLAHSRTTHGQDPSDNVLFESDEMASQRDTQNTIEAMKLKEGKILPIVLPFNDHEQ